MATEVINNVPENTEKEKEAKEDAPVDNGQTKEDPPAEKVEEKTEEKKVEAAPPKITVHKANFEKDVVYLYQFSRTPLLPSTSPYCLKVETWLRLAGIKYEVLTSVRLLGDGGYQRGTGQDHSLCIGQTTVSKYLAQFSDAVIRILLPKWIMFPGTEDQRRLVAQEFRNKYGLPDVLGAIDCTHIAIFPPPHPQGIQYKNRKGYASINTQLNVDHKAKFRSKKGQLPFVELNGEEVADSTFIIKELSEKFNKDLDSALTSEQRVVAHAMISMIENHLSWVVLWWRAKYPDSVIKGYQVNLQNALNTRLPNPILNFCYKLTAARKGMKKAKAHGIGVHSQEEILEFGKNDLRVLSDLLSDRPFFFGDEPTLLDVVAFANLAQVHFIDKEVPHPLRDAMSELFPNLVGLVSRIKERAFNDWDDICSTLDLNAHLPKPAKEIKDTKEGTGPNEKQPLPDEPEKGKGDEKEKELEKEADEKGKDKDTEKEK